MTLDSCNRCYQFASYILQLHTTIAYYNYILQLHTTITCYNYILQLHITILILQLTQNNA